MSESLDIGAIVAAAELARSRIQPYLDRTPLELSAAAARGSSGSVWLKHEQQQVTGSFKPRGSLTKVSRLSPEQRERGIVAPTAGNHGIGVAYAASCLGARAHIFLPESTDPAKLDQLTALGARIETFPDIETARLAALEAAEMHGWTYSSAYNDPDMVAGAATLGLELAEQLPEVDVVVLPIGGGGLAAGVAAALARVRPAVEVWAAATAASPTWLEWHREGRRVPVGLSGSIAEGLSGPIEPTTVTFELVRRLVTRVVPVTDQQIIAAMRWLAVEHRQTVEPSGAAAIAAVLDADAGLREARVGVLLTGRNIGAHRFAELTGLR